MYTFQFRTHVRRFHRHRFRRTGNLSARLRFRDPPTAVRARGAYQLFFTGSVAVRRGKRRRYRVARKVFQIPRPIWAPVHCADGAAA